MGTWHARWLVPGSLTLAALGAAVPTVAVAPDVPVLGRLQDGLWELRFRDGSPGRRVCWHDPWRLIQLEHPDLACDRLVIENSPDAASVQYTCRGKGYGRTTIRRESSQLLQLETQGVAGGLPFVMTGEGRRVGDCPTTARPQVVASTSRPD